MHDISNFIVDSISIYNKYKISYKQKVVLLGQGWFAKGFLDHINTNKFYITNITRHPFVNTPLLLKSVNSKNKYYKNNKFTDFIDEIIYDDILKIDIDNKNIITKNNCISWNNGYLVCGLGSNRDIGKQWIPIIEKLKNHTQMNNYSIIGSGPTGTELAFHLADLGHNVTIFDMLDDEKIYNYLTKQGKQTILEKLNYSNIKLLCGKPFTNNMEKQYGKAIFAIGSSPNYLTKNWISTSKLNLVNHNDIFFGGDCVHNTTLPRNAQVAYQQGKYIAERLNQGNIKDNDFKFDNKGISLYCSNNKYYIETNTLQFVIHKTFVELYYLIFT